MELLEHNKKTVEEAEKYIDKQKDVCIVNPCGSGKTYVMMQLLQDYPDKSATIVTKQANAKEYYYSKSDVFRKTNIVTYNKLHTDFKTGNLDAYDSYFLFLDESHYIGANKWQDAILEIKKQFNPVMVGFTATTQRYEQQGTDESIVTEYFDNNSAGNYTLTSLYNKGLFKKPDVILSLYTLENEVNKRKEEIENSDLAEKQKTKLNTELDKTVDIWRNNYAPVVLLQKHLPKYMYKEYCNRIVVYSPTYQLLLEHYDSICTMLKTIFPEKEIKAYKYAIKNSSSEKEYTQFLQEDHTYIKVLFSIDKIMETIHIDDLNVLIMMRPSISNRIITQQYGRVNRIGADNTAVIFDFVSNSLNIGKYNQNAYSSKNPKQKNNTSTLSLSNINLSYINKTNNLFESIDNILNSTIKYTYKGYTGGLSFICHIFSCDTKKVKDCLNKGYTLEQSMALGKTKNAKHTISEDTTDTEPCPKKIMNEITMLLTKYFDILLQGKDAYDEDIKQELYLWAFSNYKKFTFNGIVNKCRFQSTIRRQYSNICKNNILDRDLDENNLSITEIESCSIDMTTVIENKVFLQQFQQELCNILLSRLTKKEVIVIVKRFGLQDGCAKTLEQVATELGVTRERIRQIETKVIRKLRYYYTARILSDYFDVFVSEDINSSTHSVDYLDALNKYTSFNVNK